MSNDTRPKFSIITVCLNDITGLKRTVESVQLQTYPGEFEQIVIDGNSTDGSVEWLKTRKELGESLFYISEPDSGTYDAMNKGLHRATGDVVWWLNAGDTFANNATIELVAQELEDPRNEWGYGITVLVDQKYKPVLEIFEPEYKFKSHVLGFIQLPHPSFFAGKEILYKVNQYDSRFPIAADQVLMAELGKLIPPIVIDGILSNFLAGGVSGNQTVKHAIREIRMGMHAHNLDSTITRLDFVYLNVEFFAHRLSRKVKLLIKSLTA